MPTQEGLLGCGYKVKEARISKDGLTITLVVGRSRRFAPRTLLRFCRRNDGAVLMRRGGPALPSNLLPLIRTYAGKLVRERDRQKQMPVAAIVAAKPQKRKPEAVLAAARSRDVERDIEEMMRDTSDDNPH